MIISTDGRFFWRWDEENTDEVFSGTMIHMTIHKKWRYWSWDLSVDEILIEERE